MRKSLTLTLALVSLAACASPEPTSSAPAPSASSPVAVSPSTASSAPAPPTSASAASEPAPPPPPRIYAKTRFVWVRYEPSIDAGWYGYLWLGGHADLADTKPVQGGPGCAAWYAVKPRGFVCADGDGATLDPNDPVLVAMRPYAPDLSSPWPHKYGESRGAERYEKLPTIEQQHAREWELDQHLAKIKDGKLDGDLAGVDLTPGSDAPFFLPDIPSTMRERRRRMLPLSTVAWSRDLVSGDRSFLLTADFLFVPKDRVAPYPVSRFHGVELGKGEQLPIAFFREKPRPKYKEDGEAIVPTGETWARLEHVGLSGITKKLSGKTYLQTTDGLWVDAADATVAKQSAASPWPASAEGRKSWIEVSVLGGWLVAYENETPVYATMISPGRGGIPLRDVDPLKTASTPTGTWPITGKFATATMVAPGEFIHSDVPWTQNFHGPHALHGAYWHDGWGEKKSAGCINTSPIDGKWLFEWTDPKLPEGWHGVRFDPAVGVATRMVVHE